MRCCRRPDRRLRCVPRAGVRGVRTGSSSRLSGATRAILLIASAPKGRAELPSGRYGVVERGPVRGFCLDRSHAQAMQCVTEFNGCRQGITAEALAGEVLRHPHTPGARQCPGERTARVEVGRRPRLPEPELSRAAQECSYQVFGAVHADLRRNKWIRGAGSGWCVGVSRSFFRTSCRSSIRCVPAPMSDGSVSVARRERRTESHPGVSAVPVTERITEPTCQSNIVQHVTASCQAQTPNCRETSSLVIWSTRPSRCTRS